MNEQTESHDHHDIRVPKGALIGAGLLILFTITTVAAFRISGQDPTAQIPESEQVLMSRELKFEDSDDGSVIIYDVSDGAAAEVIDIVRSGEGGFIRGVLRSLARARNAAGISREHPFLLTLEPNSTVVLEDPQTGQRIDLQAFGPTNIESFKDLLRDDETAQ